MTDRPHVVLLSGTALSAKNGSSKVERRLAEALSARFHVTLLTRDTAPLADAPFTHAVYTRPSSKPWRLALLGARAGATILARVQATRPIALVHAFETFPAAHYAARVAAPLVITHHNMAVVPTSRWAAQRPPTVPCCGGPICCAASSPIGKTTRRFPICFLARSSDQLHKARALMRRAQILCMS